MFDADRPIHNKAQDKLNRAEFAKYLARCMLDHKDTHSFVVGLYGGWGHGKTSLINLTLDELNRAANYIEENEKPIILNFSPWSYSGQNQLIYNFFRHFSSALHSEPNLENANRIIELFELYVSFFTQKPVPKPLRTWWQTLTLQKEHDFYGWESGSDLTVIKAELNELLREQKRKIIITIDSISRLYPEELLQVFQIVKSIGDYANTIYLLAMDKNQVISAINKIYNKSGTDYLAKVVQLPFDVPPISIQENEVLFADQLDKIIKTVPNERWNREYWADIYHNALKFYFKNRRDVARFINTLSFSYPPLSEIVNPVDFFSLTAIQVFTPEVYNGIRDNKDLFSDLFENVFKLSNEENKKERLRCDEILTRDDIIIPKHIQLELVMRLFPRVRHIYSPTVAFYHSEITARKLSRICSSDLFDAYFRISLYTNQLPDDEFKMMLSTTADIETFNQVLGRLNQDNRILPFLDLLDNTQIINNINVEHIPNIINGLLNNGDLFPHGITGPLSLDTPTRIHRIIHGLLSRLNNHNERFNVLKNAIENTTKSLYILINEINEQESEHTEKEEHFIPLLYRDLTLEQVESIKQLTIKHINNWVSSGRLAEHPRFSTIIHVWLKWSDPNHCRKYIDELISTDRGLIIFLTYLLDKAITESIHHYEYKPEWQMLLTDISLFVSIEKLEQHAKAFFENNYIEKLTEREQLALTIFMELIASSKQFLAT